MAPEADVLPPNSRLPSSHVFLSPSLPPHGVHAPPVPNAFLDGGHPPQASAAMDAVPASLIPSIGDARSLPPQRAGMALDDFSGPQASTQLAGAATWWRPGPLSHNGGGAPAPGPALTYSPGAGVESPFWPVPQPGNVAPSPGVIEVVAAAEAASGSTAPTRAAPAAFGYAPPPSIHLQPMEGTAGEPWSGGGGGGIGGREAHPAVGAGLGLPVGLPTSSAPWTSAQQMGLPWTFGPPVVSGDQDLLAGAAASSASMLPVGRPRPSSVPPSWLATGGNQAPGGTPLATNPAVIGGSSVPNASPVPPLHDMPEPRPHLFFGPADMRVGNTDDHNGTADAEPVPTTTPRAVPSRLSNQGNTLAQQPRSFFQPDPAVTSSSDSVAQSGSPPSDGSQGDTDLPWASAVAALDALVVPAGPLPASWPPGVPPPHTTVSGPMAAGPVPHDAVDNVALPVHAPQHPLPSDGGAAAMARVAAAVEAANAAATERWSADNAERLRTCDSPAQSSRLSNLRAAYVSRAVRRAKSVALKQEVALAAGPTVLAAVDTTARAAGMAKRQEWAATHRDAVNAAKAEVRVATLAAHVAAPISGGGGAAVAGAAGIRLRVARKEARKLANRASAAGQRAELAAEAQALEQALWRAYEGGAGAGGSSGA